MTFKIQRRTAPEAYDAATELLTKLGAPKKHIGEGSFATVFQLDDTTVAKFVPSAGDDAYYEYVRALSKLKVHNPFTPRIDDVYMIKDRREQAMVVVMEKLTPIEDRFGLSNATEIVRVISNEIDRLVTGKLGKREEKQRAQAYQLLGGQTTAPVLSDDLIASARIMKHVLEKRMGILDICYQNVMMRGEQLVFTDPLA